MGEHLQQCDAALDGDKRAIARLVSLFEDARLEAGAARASAIAALRADPRRRHAWFVGVTGTPGAGKSSLVGELGLRLIAADPEVRVGVLAVDPASARSGGALLGDRTRVHFPTGERRLYFRSQSSELALGGLGRHSFQVCRVLDCLFDLVFVETVGIGQSETDVRALADRMYLVLQPLGGDQIQFMKAGIMEVPDAFVLNKCDEEAAARRSLAALRASLRFARPDDEKRVSVFTTSTVTGRGLDELAADILGTAPPIAERRGVADAEPRFLRRWVEEEFGRSGLVCFDEAPPGGSFDAAQAAFADRYREWLTGAGSTPRPR